MNKYPLIGGSICAVVVLFLASLTNVVGYQIAQVSNQKIINTEMNEKELLFQTIVDIANNKEIQRIILKSQVSRGIILPSNIPVFTKQQLRQTYLIGLILSKVFSKSRMQSVVGKFQFNKQVLQKEISTIIEKDATLNNKMIQLQNSECDCDNATAEYWQFPVLCALLFPIWYVSFMSLLLLAELSYVFNFRVHPLCLSVFLFILFVYVITNSISTLLNCFFIYIP